MRLLPCLIPGSLLMLGICLVLALAPCAIAALALRHNLVRATRLTALRTPASIHRHAAFTLWPVRRPAFLSTGAIE